MQDREEAKQLMITESGELDVPYLGRVQAASKTCKQLALELKENLEKDLYYHATVIIKVDALSQNRGKVYLVGQVRAPGA